jgi:hypothetical protein
VVFVVDKVAMGQFFLQFIHFPINVIAPPYLLMYHLVVDNRPISGHHSTETVSLHCNNKKNLSNAFWCKAAGTHQLHVISVMTAVELH